MVVSAAGAIENESDYYPWGGELKITAADAGNHYKFTGKERDAESGLDYFGARYYGNALGRWVTPDWEEKPSSVPYASLGDPQTLNLYSYVRGLPTTKVDLNGHGWWSDFKERWVNGWKYGEAVTNADLPKAFAKERQWLIDNARNTGGGALSPSQVNGLKNASDKQINDLYKSYENTLILKQQFTYCECVMSTNPRDYKRAEDGSLVPLTKLHSDETIVKGNSASYDYWKGQSTEAIIDSLKTGSKFGELTVKPNGVIMDGNTRIKVLEERGVNVNTLERIILEIPKEPIP
jgi:RHS repeat-associated protein